MVVNAAVDLAIVNGSDEAHILVLQGKPIGEPVIQYGPFVMNTKEEIQQAFDDYHATKFGGWPWPRYDKVHDRTDGRFARHADGTLERGAGPPEIPRLLVSTLNSSAFPVKIPGAGVARSVGYQRLVTPHFCTKK